jgi:hypothetical protein
MLETHIVLPPVTCSAIFLEWMTPRVEPFDVPKQKNLSRSTTLLILEAHSSNEALLWPPLYEIHEVGCSHLLFFVCAENSW